MSSIGFILVLIGLLVLIVVLECHNGWRQFIGIALMLIGVGVLMSPRVNMQKNVKNTSGKIEMTILEIEQKLGHGVRIIER